METQRLFERHDPVTGDGIRVDRDGDRLRFRFHVAGASSTLVLVDPADARRLAAALASALESAAG